MFKFLNRQGRGFTLIELLVVIAIIGILASIVMVSMAGARSKARDAVRKSDIRQIGSAMELYYNDNEHYYVFTPAGTNLFPTTIGTAMTSVPSSQGSINYVWKDNAGNNQKFCVYTELENPSGKFFAASHQGTKELDAAPSSLDCW